jgi:hypothetical protein
MTRVVTELKKTNGIDIQTSSFIFSAEISDKMKDMIEHCKKRQFKVYGQLSWNMEAAKL